MKNLTLFLLITPIFLAGCIGQPAEVTGVASGVIIKSFAPDFPEVAPGEPVTFSLTVQNVGDADATSTKAELFGLNPVEWGVSSFPEKNMGTLTKAIPAEKVPGGDWTDEWSLTAPSINVPKNTFTANTRVSYGYKTEAAATLRFITNDYLKSLKPDQQEKAKKSSGLVSSTSSNAPIKVSFTAGTRPFVVFGTSGKFSFQIIITNVGQGNPYDPAKDGGKISSVSLYWMKITSPDVVGTNVDIECPILTEKGFEVKLPKGTSKTISCTATARNITNVLDGTVNVTLSYSYFVDASTTVTVIQQA